MDRETLARALTERHPFPSEFRPLGGIGYFLPMEVRDNAQGRADLSTARLAMPPAITDVFEAGKFFKGLSEGDAYTGATQDEATANFARANAPHMFELPAAGMVASRMTGLDAGGVLGMFAGTKGKAKQLIRLTDDQAAQLTAKQRMDIAQHNAAVPKERGGLGLRPDNTPDERAAAMGFDTKAYHATGSDFREFDPNRFGAGESGYGGDAVGGVWTTSNPDVADTYLGGTYVNRNTVTEPSLRPIDDNVARYYSEGGNIMPLRVRDGGHDVWAWGGGYYDAPERPGALAEALESGSTGVIFEDMRDPGVMGLGRAPASDVAVTFDPKNIRSRFAAYDPARSDSANLLAANPAPAAAPAAVVNVPRRGGSPATGVQYDWLGNQYLPGT